MQDGLPVLIDPVELAELRLHAHMHERTWFVFRQIIADNRGLSDAHLFAELAGSLCSLAEAHERSEVAARLPGLTRARLGVVGRA